MSKKKKYDPKYFLVPEGRMTEETLRQMEQERRDAVLVTDTHYLLRYGPAKNGRFNIEKDMVRDPLQLLEWIAYFIGKSEDAIKRSTIEAFMIAVGNENGFNLHIVSRDYQIKRRK